MDGTKQFFFGMDKIINLSMNSKDGKEQLFPGN